jgi:hypothetical protein
MRLKGFGPFHALCPPSSCCVRPAVPVCEKSRNLSIPIPEESAVLFTRTGEAQRPPDPRRFPFFSLACGCQLPMVPWQHGSRRSGMPKQRQGLHCIRLADLATSSAMVMLSLRLLSIPIACPCWMTGTYVRMCKHFKARPESHEFHTLRSAQPSPDVGTAFRRVEYGVKV